MMSIDEMYAQDEKNSRERAANKGKAKYYPELKGLEKVGDQVTVQFCGVHGTADLAGKFCHVVHPVSKKTNGQYTLYVPCLSQDQNASDDCPLCNSPKEFKNSYEDKPVKEKIRQYIVPIFVIDLNVRYNSEKGDYVPLTDITPIDGVSQKVPKKPEVKMIRKGFKKRIIAAIYKFVQKNGDLTGKVIDITAVAPKNGNIGFDYELSLNTTVKAVQESDYDVPADKYSAAFSNQTAETMDLYLNTDTFFKPKSAETNEAPASTEGVTPRPAVASAPLPDTAPAEESYGDLPNVKMRRAD